MVALSSSQPSESVTRFRLPTTEWDSRQPDGTEIHLRTIMRDNFVCTTYQPGTVHDGTEGELYDLVLDPLHHDHHLGDSLTG